MRDIVLQGTYNFRDIGGYKTADGKRIKWGRIYRSALLSNLTKEDLQILEALKVKMVIDFRGPLEIAAYPDKMPINAEYIELPAGSKNDAPDDWAGMAESMKLSSSVASDSGSINYYKHISSLGKRYKPMFEELLNADKDSAVIIHCAGGKDRTGIAAALIEYTLGVSDNDIVADYVYSNEGRKFYNEEIANLLHLKYNVPLDRAKNYGIAKPEFIEATFDEIRKQYGSVNNFLYIELGLDDKKIAKLKELYLDNQ